MTKCWGFRSVHFLCDFLECVCSCMCEIEREGEWDPICTWILTTTTNKSVWFITSFLLRMNSARARHSLWQALHLSGWKQDKHVCVRHHTPAPADLCYTQCLFFLTWHKARVCVHTYACAQYMSFSEWTSKKFCSRPLVPSASDGAEMQIRCSQIIHHACSLH